MIININIIGAFARIISFFIPVKKKHWVFGSDCGNMYREGSKYLIEYMLKEHKDFHCTFITKNKQVFHELNLKGIPCLMNTSIKGIIRIAKADSVFFTQTTGDINFAHKKKGRHFYYLVHGMIQKKVFGLSPENVEKKKGTKKDNLRQRICKWLSTGFDTRDSDFISATSDFFVPIIEDSFNHKVKSLVLGMPRNDALFQPERMKKERWVDGIEQKFVITYMPTHRLYGKGDVTPTPFANRPDIQQWLIENNIVLLIKNHPNMIPKIKEEINTEWCIDITKKRFDPQVCIYHSDVLITDYSSVWIDYLLLERPIIFYLYDDFEQEDAGVLFDLKNENVGHYCYDEEELFHLIQKAKKEYEKMKPTKEAIKKYHHYIDGNSSERHFKEISKRYDC